MIIRIVLLTMLLAAESSYDARYAQQFEGIISIKISTPLYDDEGLETVTQRFYLKPPYIRLEAEGMSNIVVLVDNVKREMHVLDYALKRYTTNTFDEYSAEEEYEGKRMEFDMRTTNKRQTILNYETELLEFIARGDTRESFDRIKVWVTSQLGTLFGDLMVGMVENEVEKSSWQAVLIDRNLFPMKTMTFYGGSVLEETEVVAIDRRALEEELFLIPTDFRKVDLRNQ
jgi:hypothetical protein